MWIKGCARLSTYRCRDVTTHVRYIILVFTRLKLIMVAFIRHKGRQQYTSKNIHDRKKKVGHVVALFVFICLYSENSVAKATTSNSIYFSKKHSSLRVNAIL